MNSRKDRISLSTPKLSEFKKLTKWGTVSRGMREFVGFWRPISACVLTIPTLFAVVSATISIRVYVLTGRPNAQDPSEQPERRPEKQSKKKKFQRHLPSPALFVPLDTLASMPLFLRVVPQAPQAQQVQQVP